MKFIRESEAEFEEFQAPHARKIRHVVAPWTLGSKHVWFGVNDYPAGGCSNAHTHEDSEETFYVISGSGQIKVEDTIFDVTVGDTVFVEPGEVHQILNLEGTETLKLVSVVTPPFTRDDFSSSHK